MTTEIKIIILISVLLFVAIGYLIHKVLNIQYIQTMNMSQQNQQQQNENKNQENLAVLRQLSKNIVQNQENIKKEINRMNEKNSSNSEMISRMSLHIDDINNIMINKKSRGNWGEYQLNSLISIYAGESKEVFESQYTLKNGMIGDVALHLPGSEKVMVIDSKFPMENYKKLVDENLNDEQFNKYKNAFKQDIKKHINDISNKYIISTETTDLAIMFIPSEAIYTYICAENTDLIDYGHKQHVLITSPTTLLGVVFTLVNATKDYNRTKNIKSIEKQIVLMSDDARRLVERLDKVQNNVNTLQKSLDDAKISSKSLNKRIQKIVDGYTDENDI